MTKVLNSGKRVFFTSMMILMLIAMMLSSVVAPAYALGEFPEEPVTLTACYNGEMGYVPGVTMKAYKIASMDSNAQFTVEEEFAGYSIDFSALDDQDQWRTFGETMANYIDRNSANHTPKYTAVTNDAGIAEFGEVEPGLYVVVCPVYKYKKTTYTVDVSVLTAPALDVVTGEWMNESVFYPKYRSETEPAVPPATQGLEVLKIWKDENVESVTRPDSIEVELVCDGTVIDTQILDKNNGWTYKWQNLEIGKKYSIVEKTVPEGYTVTVTQDSDTQFTVTNTAIPKEEEEEPEKPEEPKNPPVNPPSNPPADKPTTPTPSSPTLPDTGVHWMGAIMFGAAGIVVLTLGILRRRSGVVE